MEELINNILIGGEIEDISHNYPLFFETLKTYNLDQKYDVMVKLIAFFENEIYKHPVFCSGISNSIEYQPKGFLRFIQKMNEYGGLKLLAFSYNWVPGYYKDDLDREILLEFVKLDDMLITYKSPFIEKMNIENPTFFKNIFDTLDNEFTYYNKGYYGLCYKIKGNANPIIFFNNIILSDRDAILANLQRLLDDNIDPENIIKHLQYLLMDGGKIGIDNVGENECPIKLYPPLFTLNSKTNYANVLTSTQMNVLIDLIIENDYIFCVKYNCIKSEIIVDYEEYEPLVKWFDDRNHIIRK